MNRRTVLRAAVGGFVLPTYLAGRVSPEADPRSVQSDSESDTEGSSPRHDFRSDTVRGTFADVRSYDLPDFFGRPPGGDAFATAVVMLYPGGVPIGEYDWESVEYESTELDDGSHAIHDVEVPIEAALRGTYVGGWCSPDPLEDQCRQLWCDLQSVILDFLGDGIRVGDLVEPFAVREWQRRNDSWAATPEDAPITVRGDADERRRQAAAFVREQFTSMAADLRERVADVWLTMPTSSFISIDSTYRGPDGTPGILATYEPDVDAALFSSCPTHCEEAPTIDCLSDVESWELTASYRVDSMWNGYWTAVLEAPLRDPLRATILYSERMDATVVLERYDPDQPEAGWVSRSGSATATTSYVESLDGERWRRAGGGRQTYEGLSLGDLGVVFLGGNPFEVDPDDPSPPENYFLSWPVVPVQVVEDGEPVTEAVGEFPSTDDTDFGAAPGEPRGLAVVDPVPAGGYLIHGVYGSEIRVGDALLGSYLDSPFGDPVVPTVPASWRWTLRPLSFGDGCDLVTC
jgi:hypothetical protein